MSLIWHAQSREGRVGGWRWGGGPGDVGAQGATGRMTDGEYCKQTALLQADEVRRRHVPAARRCAQAARAGSMALRAGGMWRCESTAPSPLSRLQPATTHLQPQLASRFLAWFMV